MSLKFKIQPKMINCNLCSFNILWRTWTFFSMFRNLKNAPVSLAGNATALVRRTKKLTDTQQDRRDGLVEHLRRYYFACVAYQLRIDDAWVTHMRRIWRMDGDATAYDVAYENLTIAYSRRKWRIHSEHPTYRRRSTWFDGAWRAYVQRMGCVHAKLINTPHYMWAVSVIFKCVS